MSSTSTITDVPTEQQQLLVERILASALFRKSHRLSAFLKFICEQHHLGRAESINEQLIGTAVFGRPAGYHVGEDSIVRSQARFLRQRLQEYFTTVGTAEPVTLTIPKGSYVPAYEYREAAYREALAEHLPAELADYTLTLPEPIAVLHPSFAQEDPLPSARGRSPLLWSALAVALLCIAAPLVWYGIVAFRAHSGNTAETRFWSSIFDPQRTQIIVPADSSLILMEELTDTPVLPADYMSRKYLEVAPPPGTPAIWQTLRKSQYTNLVDLNLVSRLERRPEAATGKVQIRYARDLNLSELKETNAILIGGARANPWVNLFDSLTHFTVDYDWQTHTNFVHNQIPVAGERERYDEVGAGGQHVAYGVVAYLPSLDGEGSALLVGGTSKAGTEAAGEFLFNNGFPTFLRTLDSGGRLPHFEVLLSAQSLNGGSHHVEIVSVHKLPDPPQSH